jgi:predicted naringenin-chalcone synthase
MKEFGDMAQNVERYKSFEIFIQAYHEVKEDENKIAMLLHPGGEELLDVYDSFTLSETERQSIDVVLRKFDEFFAPITNVTYE